MSWPKPPTTRRIRAVPKCPRAPLRWDPEANDGSLSSRLASPRTRRLIQFAPLREQEPTSSYLLRPRNTRGSQMPPLTLPAPPSPQPASRDTPRPICPLCPQRHLYHVCTCHLTPPQTHTCTNTLAPAPRSASLQRVRTHAVCPCMRAHAAVARYGRLFIVRKKFACGLIAPATSVEVRARIILCTYIHVLKRRVRVRARSIDHVLAA